MYVSIHYTSLSITCLCIAHGNTDSCLTCRSVTLAMYTCMPVCIHGNMYLFDMPVRVSMATYTCLTCLSVYLWQNVLVRHACLWIYGNEYLYNMPVCVSVAICTCSTCLSLYLWQWTLVWHACLCIYGDMYLFDMPVCVFMATCIILTCVRHACLWFYGISLTNMYLFPIATNRVTQESVWCVSQAACNIVWSGPLQTSLLGSPILWWHLLRGPWISRTCWWTKWHSCHGYGRTENHCESRNGVSEWTTILCESRWQY